MLYRTYVTIEDVQNVCAQLGIRDWTRLPDARIEMREARIIQKVIGSEALDLPVEEFRFGLEEELKHGLRYPDANITSNHPILTGRIVLAHLKEGLDYYVRLRCLSLERRLFEAVAVGDVVMGVRMREELASQRGSLRTGMRLRLVARH